MHLSGVHAAGVLRASEDGTGLVRVPRRCRLPASAGGADAGRRRSTGAIAGIEGEAAAVVVAERLALDAGLVPHAIPAERALYHAAAVSVAGHATALFAQAMSLIEAAGLGPDAARRALQPLFASAAANLARGAPADVITGPVSRGDVATVVRHLEALEAHGDRDVLAVYRALGRDALRLSAGRLEAAVVAELSAVLAGR